MLPSTFYVPTRPVSPVRLYPRLRTPIFSSSTKWIFLGSIFNLNPPSAPPTPGPSSGFLPFTSLQTHNITPVATIPWHIRRQSLIRFLITSFPYKSSHESLQRTRPKKCIPLHRPQRSRSSSSDSCLWYPKRPPQKYVLPNAGILTILSSTTSH